MADDEDDDDGEEHHGNLRHWRMISGFPHVYNQSMIRVTRCEPDLVVAALVGGDGVVEPCGAVDGAVDAGVEDDEGEEGDDDQRERVGDHHVVPAVEGPLLWSLFKSHLF